MNKKLIILSFEFPPCTGGVSRYSLEMAIAATKLKYDVTVWTSNYGKDSSRFDAELPFKVVRFSSGTFKTRHMLSLLGRSFLCKLKGFDLIHAVDWPNIIAFSFWNKLMTMPFIATVHGTEIQGLKSSKIAHCLGVRNPFADACKVTTNSYFTKTLLIKCFPILDKRKIQVTYLGVNQNRFNIISPRVATKLRKKWNIPHDNTIITTIARIDKRKGQKETLMALSGMGNEIQERVSYIIVGKADDDNYLKELKTDSKKTKSQIVFTSEISDEEVEEIYSIADIFCMPGMRDGVKVEGFGLSYLEAALYEIPSIGSRLHAVPEVIEDGKTGLLVSEKNEEGLITAIEKLVNDVDYSKQLGYNAKRRAQMFTWEKCAKSTYSV